MSKDQTEYLQADQSVYPHLAPPPSYEASSYQNSQLMGQDQPQQPQQIPAVVHTVYQPQVGPEPTSIACPSCRHSVVTTIDYKTTTKTHIVAGILCAFVCWPCAWIPYVMDSCKNADHYCPNCGAFIGTYKN